MRDKNGISLLTLTITIIVLLIIAGIAYIVLDQYVVNKAVESSNKTTYASWEERIQMVWVDCESTYLSAKENNPDLVKEDYFSEKLPKLLLSMEKNLQNISITGELEKDTYINFNYKNKEYTFLKTQEGNVFSIYELKDNVKVGDYIEYDIEYSDVYSGETYTAQNGWRIIDNGSMKGTSEKVKVVSKGIPATMDYTTQGVTRDEVINNMVNNFESLDLYKENDYENSVKGSTFKVDSITNKISALTLSELNYAYNEMCKDSREVEDISDFSKYNDLFHFRENNAYYWLATPNSNDANGLKMYYMRGQKIKSATDLNIGVRPVNELKDGLRGIYNSGVWQIIN